MWSYSENIDSNNVIDNNREALGQNSSTSDDDAVSCLPKMRDFSPLY